LLSTTPVADVVAASEFGFTGGLCFGSGGSGEWVGNGVVVADTPGTGSNPTETETETQNKSSPAKQKLLNLPRRPSLPKLKVGGMGHPAATHRGVRGVLGGNGFGAKKRRKEWRKSFDATHLPENWMDLDGIPSEDEEGEGDAEKEKETEDGDSREGPTGFSKFAPRESKWGSGSLLEENTAANANATRPNKKTPYAQLPTPRVENALAISVPGKSKVTEVKPKIVRWVKSHEWALRPDRQFDDAQRREMRWYVLSFPNPTTVFPYKTLTTFFYLSQGCFTSAPSCRSRFNRAISSPCFRKGLSQSPRSASAIAHTRTRRDYYLP